MTGVQTCALPILAQVAACIADAESNIQNVAVEPQDGGKYAAMQFTLQVLNRQHLARIMRDLRRIPEVARINRVHHASRQSLN